MLTTASNVIASKWPRLTCKELNIAKIYRKDKEFVLMARTPNIQEMPRMGRSTATALAVNLKKEQVTNMFYCVKYIYLLLKMVLDWFWKQINSLDWIGVSVNLVILSADSRYDPGHRYQNTDVHLKTRQEVKHIKHSDTGRGVAEFLFKPSWHWI